MPAILSKIRGWVRNVRNFFLNLFNRFLSFILRKTKRNAPSKEAGENSETAPLLDNEVLDTGSIGGTEVEQTVEVVEQKTAEVNDQVKETAEVLLKQTVEVINQLEKPPTENNDQMEQIANVIDQLEQHQNIEADESQREQQTEFFSPMSKMSNDTFRSCEAINESDFDLHTLRTGSCSTFDKESNEDADNDAVEDKEEDLSDGTWNAEDESGPSSSSSLSTASEGSIHMNEESSDEDAIIDKSEDDEYVGGDGSGDDIVGASKENDLIVNKEFIDTSSTLKGTLSSSFRD